MFQQRGMWRPLPQDPSVARMGPSLCALGGSLYLIGGGSELHFQDEDFARADGERYDFALKKWFKIAPMKYRRRDATYVALFLLCYLVGVILSHV